MIDLWNAQYFAMLPEHCDNTEDEFKFQKTVDCNVTEMLPQCHISYNKKYISTILQE